MFDFLFNPSTAQTVGAGYAAIQAIAFFLARLLPPHTIVAKAATEITKWPAQLLPVRDPANGGK